MLRNMWLSYYTTYEDGEYKEVETVICALCEDKELAMRRMSEKLFRRGHLLDYKDLLCHINRLNNDPVYAEHSDLTLLEMVDDFKDRWKEDMTNLEYIDEFVNDVGEYFKDSDIHNLEAWVDVENMDSKIWSCHCKEIYVQF